MNVDGVVALVDRLVHHRTKKHLTDLQQVIITQVWQRKKYWEIADEYGCTEGHAKDTGSLLWKLLSEAWGKKVTKSNFRSLINQELQLLGDAEINFNQNINSPSRDLAIREVPDFLGRQTAIATIDNLINQGNKIIVLQGEGGIGKTTLAQKFLADRGFEIVLEVLMAKETVNIISAASVIEEWLQRDLNQESGKEFGVTLLRLKRYLEQHRVGILIDNLEPALDRDGRLISSQRDYLELLRILADSKVQSVTLITSRDRLCEGEINLVHYRLSGLDLAAWQQFFAAHQIQTENKAITQIQQIYGGNAKAMGLLCGIIREDYDGNIEQYWLENRHDPLVETDLKNLVASQFNRLEQLDLQAYKLLCRLGCYRYQDLSQIDQPGLLCLLWDVDNRQQRRVIKSLRNRSLLEFAQGKYWLHPVLQTEARLRLQLFPVQWQQAHRQIASYLTVNITRVNNIQDGLTAFEAYYHYLAIKDYVAAAQVILYSRENQWGQFLTLGTTLFRLGIIQPLLTAINCIITRVEHDRRRSELNNILGDLYWTSGKIHLAIACQQKTIVTSQRCLQLIAPITENKHDLYYWRMLEVDSLLSLGLYNIDLWELMTAANLFQQVIELADNTKHHAWSEKAALALALVSTYREPLRTLPPIVSQLYRLIVELDDQTYNTGRFAYFIQLLGQIFFNHQQIAPARIMWHRAIAFSQASHYTQIKAKSLTGLATIERQENNFDLALTYHQEATELLDKIGAKCDLADAYLQWGITLHHHHQMRSSKDCFEQAISLYQQIKAPKQIDRVRLMWINYD